ncbi:MAG: hypothetical protein HQ500_00805 [Flavobacteriales bacterium]|nr:hypothetical protein [Flavobacteriales bacterium]
MLELKGNEAKCLREGGTLNGLSFSISPFIGQAADVILCGTDQQVQGLLSDAHRYDALLQIMDSGERLRLEIETENDRWLSIIADLDLALGQLALQARRPLAIVDLSNASGTTLPSEQADKTLPLHPRFEQELLAELERYADRFQQFKDGSFKLIRQK